MRLTVDLRFAGSALPDQDGERVVTLDRLAVTRSPRQLNELLRSHRWEVVRILRDSRPLNGVQAGALGLAALAPTDRFEIATPDRTVTLGSASMLARATATFALAFPTEVARIAFARRRAATVAARKYALAKVPLGRPIRSVTYLRSEPSLRYMGVHVGGAAAHTAGVIGGFRHAGVDVDVVAPEPPEGIDGITVTEVTPRRIFHLVHWPTLISYSEQQVRAALSHRSDVVYQRYALGSYAGLELAHKLNVPLILEFNGSEIWAEREWGAGEVRFAETLSALEQRHVCDASLVVVVSDVLKDQLVRDGVDPERILVNPNGVDVDRLAHARALPPAAWRSRLGKPEAPTVGFIGTFGPWHGVRVLPSIIAAVAAHRDDVRWIVVGDGALFHEVRDVIERLGLADRVELTGVVPHQRAMELLAACDVCVSPHVPNPDGTRFFGSPTKLFEYMGLAKAIVASDLEQIGEVIEHEQTGLLCPPGDAEAAAQAVLRLLDDEGLRRRLGEAALEEARTTYSWDAHSRRILDAASGLTAAPEQTRPAEVA
jgi:glycosyltransferase involved in cell wall biosynthesis